MSSENPKVAETELDEFLSLVGTGLPEEGGIGLHELVTCGRCGGEAWLKDGKFVGHQCDGNSIDSAMFVRLMAELRRWGWSGE